VVVNQKRTEAQRVGWQRISMRHLLKRAFVCDAFSIIKDIKKCMETKYNHPVDYRNSEIDCPLCVSCSGLCCGMMLQANVINRGSSLHIIKKDSSAEDDTVYSEGVERVSRNKAEKRLYDNQCREKRNNKTDGKDVQVVHGQIVNVY